MTASVRLYRKFASTLSVNYVACAIILCSAQIVAQSAAVVAPARSDAAGVQSSATLVRTNQAALTPQNGVPGKNDAGQSTGTAANGASKPASAGGRTTQNNSGNEGATATQPQSEEGAHRI